MNTTNHINDPEEPITIMFVDMVKPEKVEQYENWLNGVHGDMKAAKGFLNVTVIRPGDQGSTEYTILIKFDSFHNLSVWRESDAELKWLSIHSDLVQETANIHQTSGLDIWFSRPSSSTGGRPAYWKQVVLGVITVYPMILILNVLLSPITDHLPLKTSLLLTVVALSSLLTYPVMPYASKLLANWLTTTD